MGDNDERSTTGNEQRRGRGDGGLALVEFSFVMVPLLILLLGTVAFGFLLSVKQTVTQGAAEGARAAVGTFSRNAIATQNPTAAELAAWKTDAENTAIAHMHEALSWLEHNVDYSANPDAIDYLARVHDCSITDRSLLEDPNATVDDPNNPDDCLYTKITYHHSAHRILPMIPLIESFLPHDVISRADVALT